MVNELPPPDRECFFIAPIGEAGSEDRKRSDRVLRFIVDKAVSELDLKAVRADQIAQPGQINLQLIDHLLNARAVVADLTGLNPNVFYEIGVRHAARLPLVLIAETGTKLPFDLAPIRTILFDHTDLESSDACREQIAAQLHEALVNGIVDSPIATSLDVTSMSRGNPAERSVAEMVTVVEGLARSQREILAAIEKMQPDSPVLPAKLISDLAHALDQMALVANAKNDRDVLEALNYFYTPVNFLRRQYDGVRILREDASGRAWRQSSYPTPPPAEPQDPSSSPYSKHDPVVDHGTESATVPADESIAAQAGS